MNNLQIRTFEAIIFFLSHPVFFVHLANLLSLFCQYVLAPKDIFVSQLEKHLNGEV